MPVKLFNDKTLVQRQKLQVKSQVYIFLCISCCGLPLSRAEVMAQVRSSWLKLGERHTGWLAELTQAYRKIKFGAIPDK